MADIQHEHINPADGYSVFGVKLDEHRFIGGMKGSQLLSVAEDPRRTEDIKQRSGNTALESLFRLRQAVQRLFEGAKRRNVEAYAQYIVRLHKGEIGMTPAIVLFCEQDLKTAVDEKSVGFLQVPWGHSLIAIDGETQLAARFEAASIDPSTRDQTVPVLICHGRSIPWARQVFHDLNLLAVKPNTAVGIGMDQRDPLTYVARQVEGKIPFLSNRVNMNRRQLKKTDPEVVTITSLRGACITLALGIKGVQYGAKPVHFDHEKIDEVEKVAIDWFTAICKLLGPAIEDRENSLASAPAVFAAIGAVGHGLLGISDPAKRLAEQQRLLDLLAKIDWKKGDRWKGIAGKSTPKGDFSVGGPKETGHAIYNALIDTNDPGFDVIRKTVSRVTSSSGQEEEGVS